MGVSTNGFICYGIAFDEDYTFPWGTNDYESWWFINICKFKPTVEIYTEIGSYVNNKEPDQKTIDNYYNEYSKFKKDHPMPFDVENYCSGDYPMDVLVVNESVIKCGRGEPTEINFSDIQNKINNSNLKSFMDFINTYIPDKKNTEPKWMLCSYWG